MADLLLMVPVGVFVVVVFLLAVAVLLEVVAGVVIGAALVCRAFRWWCQGAE